MNPFRLPDQLRTGKQEVNPDTTPRLRCKICKEVCMRSPIDGSWTHDSEEIIVNIGSAVITTDPNYDHPAEPDYIDTVLGE